MRLRIRHRLQIRFPEPTRNVIGVLRLTPRSHEGQRITDWRIDVDPDCLLRRGEDHFGNLIATLNIPGATTHVTLTAQGQLTCFDAAGVVRGSAERLPVELFRRETPATMPDARVRRFAVDAVARSGSDLGRLHDLMGAIHGRIAVEPGSVSPKPAMAVLADETSDAGGHAQLFTACARHLGFPARCASGYVLEENGPSRRHAWAEAHVENLGWVGFDTVHDICPQDYHVRVAVGLDAIDAAPVRSTPGEFVSETVDVTWLFGREPAAQGQARAHEATTATGMSPLREPDRRRSATQG